MPNIQNPAMYLTLHIETSLWCAGKKAWREVLSGKRCAMTASRMELAISNDIENSSSFGVSLSNSFAVLSLNSWLKVNLWNEAKNAVSRLFVTLLLPTDSSKFACWASLTNFTNWLTNTGRRFSRLLSLSALLENLVEVLTLEQRSSNFMFSVTSSCGSVSWLLWEAAVSWELGTNS